MKYHLNTSISRLLLWCGPSAVTRLVVPVVVDAVEAGAFWPLPHVREEVGKGMEPAVTDGDPSAAVPSPCLVFGRQAATEHSPPTAISWRLIKTSVAMRQVHCSAVFPSTLQVPAATTLGSTTSQVMGPDFCEVSAITNAKPIGSTASRRRFGDNCQFMKALTEKINLEGHRELVLSGVMRQAVSAVLPPSILLHHESELPHDPPKPGEMRQGRML